MIRRTWLRALLALALAGLVAACSSDTPGPLRNVNQDGQPNFSVAWIKVDTGQSADFTTFLVNTAKDPVTLVSAKLIPIPGHPSGQLVYLAVGLHHDGVAAARGWPPGVPIGGFKGTRLPHGQTNVIFGFRARANGAWYAAGIKITYKYQGATYQMDAWSASVACVALLDSRCHHLMDVARRGTEKLAGVG
jgi:hypothetical protein